MEFNEQGKHEPVAIDDFGRYGDTEVKRIVITELKNNPDIELCFNPETVHGRLRVESPVKDKWIDFKYFRGKLIMDLSAFPFTLPEMEIVKHKVVEYCKYASVTSDAANKPEQEGKKESQISKMFVAVTSFIAGIVTLILFGRGCN